MIRFGKDASDTIVVPIGSGVALSMELRGRGVAGGLREPALVAGLAAIIAAGSALLFRWMLTRELETDLPSHMRLAALSIEMGAWPPNFLYYWTVALFAGFSAETSRLQSATVFVLSASCALRFLAGVWVGRQLLRECPGWDQRPGVRCAFYIAVALLQVAHNVIDYTRPNFYVGFFTSNVWHNSTTIFLMPWAILLFYAAYRAVTRCSTGDLLLLAGMGVVNVAIKSSLIQVMVLAVPPAALLAHRFSFRLIKVGLALLPAVLFVVGQYVLLYTHFFADSVMARYHEELGVSGESKVAFEFLALWPSHTLSTVVCSFLYPIAVLGILCIRRSRDNLFGFAVACLAVALLQYMCLVETGFRRYHGNFTWQVLICTHLLFLASLIVQFRHVLRRDEPGRRDLLAGVLFMIHVLCGVGYIAGILLTRTYY